MEDSQIIKDTDIGQTSSNNQIEESRALLELEEGNSGFSHRSNNAQNVLCQRELALLQLEQILTKYATADSQKFSKRMGQLKKALLSIKEVNATEPSTFIRQRQIAPENCELIRAKADELLKKFSDMLSCNPEEQKEFGAKGIEMNQTLDNAIQRRKSSGYEPRNKMKLLDHNTCDVEAQIYSKENTLRTKILKYVIKTLSNRRCMYLSNQKINYTIWIRSLRDLNLFKKMKFFKMPDLSSVSIFSCPSNNKYVYHFLESCLPRKCENLYLKMKSLTNANRYLTLLVAVSQRAQRSISFSRFKKITSKGSLQKLLAANRQKKSVGFEECSISCPTMPDLRTCLKSTTITNLSFFLSGQEEYSDWSNNLREINNLLEALSQSDLMKTLRSINLHELGLPKQEVDKLLSSLGFGRVTNVEIM
ncbi:unnamed protein product [Moneuplotes crassus]|uniref:Uncharacterized protein n=1 Tax=Euplotes crassus TaxID=5936 RepID=A0AAD1UAL6_EUPCR|nr:unnamed protein product [Moneuplotes crassus]